MMVNLTLSISDTLKLKMQEHPEIRWSSVVRTVIEEKISNFEEAEKLAKKSRLTEKDVEHLTQKINAAGGKHAEALLLETYRRR